MSPCNLWSVLPTIFTTRGHLAYSSILGLRKTKTENIAWWWSWWWWWQQRGTAAAWVKWHGWLHSSWLGGRSRVSSMRGTKEMWRPLDGDLTVENVRHSPGPPSSDRKTRRRSKKSMDQKPPLPPNLRPKSPDSFSSVDDSQPNAT